MKKFQRLPVRRQYLCITTVIMLLASFLVSIPVKAEGGIALSGSFYQQSFEIPQGSSVNGPDVYVVVFNNTSDNLQVIMSSLTPPGVSLVLSETDFTLPVSGQKQIQVGVEVGTEATPGQYEISIAVEPYKETVNGLELVGAASQKASLTVTGESGQVKVQATSPDQKPIAAVVRLFRIKGTQQREVSYSESGSLELKVAPGSFLACSYLGGVKLAEEYFDIAAGENKNINLSGATVYFEGFDVVPNYEKEGGKLAFVQIVYTIKNLYQRVEKGEVLLTVRQVATDPEEVSLAVLSPLETGRAGLNYNYIPNEGWTAGTYEFQLNLKLDDKHYAGSSVKTLDVNGGSQNPGGSTAGTGGIGLNPYLIAGIAVLAVVVIVVVFLLVRKPRRG